MELSQRLEGALWGMAIGDALAMPVHWYYDLRALQRDYGRVRDYLAPRNPHPDSILWRSHYRAAGPEGEILHEQARYWGLRDIHYHQFLQAGENSINLKLAEVLLESLLHTGQYDRRDYLERYRDYMQDPESHRDTYLEEYHRGFFGNLARGRDLEDCAVDDVHIGGLAHLAALLLWYSRDVEKLRQAARSHVSATHGRPLLGSAEIVAETLFELVHGADPTEQLLRAARDPRGPWSEEGVELEGWLPHRDTVVVRGRFGAACYIQLALPATLYLALKYHDSFEAGLVANTNLGGDNCHRGAVLGALLGACCGVDGIPARWLEGLECRQRMQQLLARWSLAPPGVRC